MAVGVKVIQCVVLSFLLSATACGWRGGSVNSVLVIAVENLAFDRVACDSDEITGRDFESFRQFCEEGVRFTHAFTTSTLSQPAIASLFTGLYPLEHGVRSNGADFLPADLETVAEAAVKSGRRTALISGGPPILRKSGLSQGFEVFDDNFPIREQVFFRPSGEVNRLFLNWLDRIGGESFFALLYLADLQFPETVTTSELGERRERGRESQTREVGESLGELIRSMKERGIWHRTHIVLVGLNGASVARPGEIPPLNLHSENTRVSLFLKPARRSRDTGPQWTIDKNVSLADVGYSLYDFLGQPAPQPRLASLPRVTLFRLVEQPQADWDDNRMLLVESHWGAWRAISSTRYAARRRQYFYVHDERPRVYNTLLDRLETNPLPDSDPLWTTLDADILDFFEQNEIPRWSIQDEVAWQKILFAHAQWSQPDAPVEMGEFLGDRQTRRWRMARLVIDGDWAELAALAKRDRDLIAAFVAARNLGQNARLPRDPCARLFSTSAPRHGEDRCADDLLVALAQAARVREPDQREAALERFYRLYRFSTLDTVLGAANFSRYLIWDVSTELPKGLSKVDLFLALPERRGLREELRNRKSREDRAVDL